MVSAEFREKAKTFGPVDAKTAAHRAALKKAGFAVEFHSGMTDAQALKVLRSKETKRILESTNVIGEAQPPAKKSMSTLETPTGGCCSPPPCYAVFIRTAGNWVQESVPFDSYADAQAHAKLVRRARVFVEMTRVRRIPHNVEGEQPPC